MSYVNGIGHADTDTSLAAMPTVESAKSVRSRVLELLTEEPMTCDEVATALKLSPFTVRPRLTELRQAGQIVDSGVRKTLVSGKSGIVWLA
ncbi:hypothetical protein Cp1R7AA1_164 [Mesorhizobium phage Cp1R7A-A1]|nr:hypothetical protein Cp1R7AA1_164 [Mesorhizobium phage Cp1R7A-A1]